MSPDPLLHDFAVRDPAGFRLGDVDLSYKLTHDGYEERLAQMQAALRAVQLAFFYRGVTGVVVMEGWDASGKGGIIRRMSSPLDPRFASIWPIGAPDETEAKEHYLQRFWRRVPQRGELAVFDRSWYGRVLVERVEGFAPEVDWRRAYGEIRAFEQALIAEDIRIVKLFLHISSQEQADRFRARLRDPVKRWKLTPDDLRNRAKRPAYEAAIEDMVRETSTPEAPWHVIPGENKKYARIAALRLVAETLSEGVDLSPPEPKREFLETACAELGVDPGEIAAKPPRV